VNRGILGATLRIVAIVLPAVCVGAILSTAGSTLGYDYEAYVRAAQRILDGQPLYDPAVDLAGGFAIYLYPPPFAIAMIPFALLPSSLGPWPWIGLLIGAFVVGVAAMPASATVRWLVLLLGGIDWPVLYSVKLGQVTILLFLLFVLAWRWLDRPAPLGMASAAGVIVKLQPALLLVWAALTGRWRAVAVGLGALAIAAVVATVIVGAGAWADYVSLLGRVSEPVTTPHNFTPGAIAYQLGAGESVAGGVQVGSMALALLAVLAAARWAAPDASLLTAIVASQLLSPLLWDHYAAVLLLPTAWLLQRGHWWAVLIPLSTNLLLVGLFPAVVYPIAFAVALIAPLVVGWRRGGTFGAVTTPGWVG
jgi:hypothetical protein